MSLDGFKINGAHFGEFHKVMGFYLSVGTQVDDHKMTIFSWHQRAKRSSVNAFDSPHNKKSSG